MKKAATKEISKKTAKGASAKSKDEIAEVASQLLTLAEAVKRSGISKSTLHDAGRRGLVETVETNGGTRLFIIESLDHYKSNRPEGWSREKKL